MERLASPSGLTAELTGSGALRRLDCGPLTLTLFVGNEVEGTPANIYLRRRGGAQWTPLLGPASPTRFGLDAARTSLVGEGDWLGIHYVIALVLALEAPVWIWQVRLENTTAEDAALDLTYAQDLGLAPYGAARLNEYYVSQYVDHTPLVHPGRGVMIASRQNQAADGRNPWCLIGSLRRGVSFATDALELHGLATRAALPPAGIAGELPGRRLQHEHSMAVVRDAPIELAPGAAAEAGFFGRFLADHPPASSEADLSWADESLALMESQGGAPAAAPPDAARTVTLFASAPALAARQLDAGRLRALYPGPWRHEERDESGAPLSFFHGEAAHVVLRAKELRVLRPHGQLLRTGDHLTPDESALTSTVWMSGVFHSMLTQGHVSINRLLSTTHGYLGLFHSHGLRIFVGLEGAWQRLDVPSAFEMTPEACRWIYRHALGELEVRAAAHDSPHRLTLAIEVTEGADVPFLLCHHIAMNGDDGAAPGVARWRIEGEQILVTAAPGSDVARRFPEGRFRIELARATPLRRAAGDELLFEDGRSRGEPYLCLETEATRRIGVVFRGELLPQESDRPITGSATEPLVPALALEPPAGQRCSEDAARLGEIFPWLAQNALVHYLAPRGLEQYSGGGWGTRDVCQGPVEMLLALGRFEPVRDVLLKLMAAQNPDGDWPQWFMFFERERAIRAGDSHGDIVFWPLVALGRYLIASADAGLLEESLPFFDARGAGQGEAASLWEHVRRALALARARTIAGTRLAAYGHGDWNDSLQPADPTLRERMCSAWTVTLHHQALTTLARALRALGWVAEAEPLEREAAEVHGDMQRLLLPDGVLAGYAVFDGGAAPRYLLHPRDETTGVALSSLAMVHAILEDLLTPAQAREHLALLAGRLSGPDGLRLFDRPLPYHGGPPRIFQRAETAAFFGREIGLMYMHAHLRYAQALAHVGHSEAFFQALCQANPIAVRALVPSAAPRQANCYYSSSDAAFADRYQARAEYGRIAGGTVALEGGWRVYSSGAGIALSLIVRQLLGLALEADTLRVDPVLPPALDGLRARLALRGRRFEVTYRVGPSGCAVRSITLNGHALAFSREPNPHRAGAARVSGASLERHLAPDNTLGIEIG
jgi:cellobiose phosphorylase